MEILKKGGSHFRINLIKNDIVPSIKNKETNNNNVKSLANMKIDEMEESKHSDEIRTIDSIEFDEYVENC